MFGNDVGSCVQFYGKDSRLHSCVIPTTLSDRPNAMQMSVAEGKRHAILMSSMANFVN